MEKMRIFLIGMFFCCFTQLHYNSEWISQESRHFIVYYRENMFSDEEARSFLEKQENALEFVNAYLGVQYGERIDYYFYPPEELTSRAPARADISGKILIAWYEEYRNWPGEAHELTHIVAYRILGVPPPFFGEGLAVALDCAFRGYPDYPHKFCNAAIGVQAYCPLELLLINPHSCEYSSLLYWEGGSFTSFLINTYGIEKFKQLWSSLSIDSPMDYIKLQIASVYGFSIGELETEWLYSLEDVPTSEDFHRAANLMFQCETLEAFLHDELVLKPFSGRALKIDGELDLFSKALSKGEFEKAEQYLASAAELSAIWKEARNMYIEALELLPTREYVRIIPALEKAQEGYEKVGDTEFSERCNKYIEAFSILQESIQFLENEDYKEGEEHFVKAQNLFEELGEQEYVNYIEDLIISCQRGRKTQIIIYAAIFSLVFLLGLIFYLRRR